MLIQIHQKTQTFSGYSILCDLRVLLGWWTVIDRIDVMEFISNYL